MVVNGNFDGYIRQIPFRETPGRPKDQTLFYDQWPKTFYFCPKSGPKCTLFMPEPKQKPDLAFPDFYFGPNLAVFDQCAQLKFG